MRLAALLCFVAAALGAEARAAVPASEFEAYFLRALDAEQRAAEERVWQQVVAEVDAEQTEGAVFLQVPPPPKGEDKIWRDGRPREYKSATLGAADRQVRTEGFDPPQRYNEDSSDSASGFLGQSPYCGRLISNLVKCMRGKEAVGLMMSDPA